MSTESIYAKPVVPRIVLRPALVSVALHALLLAMLTVNWTDSSTKVIQAKPAPRVINARLVDASEFRPKPKPKPVAPKPKPKAKPKPAAPKPAPAAPKPAAKPAPAAVKPTPKIEPAKPVPAPPRISQQELEAIARADMARAMAEELRAEAEASATATITAAEMSASFAALIQQTVISRWSRPPSARNGMEALLQIQLIPTGEIVSVSVLKSSGSTAFDRSAVNAVEKAGSFPELKNLPPGEFEKTFRRFRLLFRPEDLRY